MMAAMKQKKKFRIGFAEVRFGIFVAFIIAMGFAAFNSAQDLTLTQALIAAGGGMAGAAGKGVGILV